MRYLYGSVSWESDAFYIRFSEETITESEEVCDGVILDFAENGRLVGVEILRIRQRFDPKDLAYISVEVPVQTVW